MRNTYHMSSKCLEANDDKIVRFSSSPILAASFCWGGNLSNVKKSIFWILTDHWIECSLMLLNNGKEFMSWAELIRRHEDDSPSESWMIDFSCRNENIKNRQLSIADSKCTKSEGFSLTTAR